MYYVYFLHLNNNQIYTGYSSDIESRVKYHEAGRVTSTKHKRPVRLLGYEAYHLSSDARRRERFMKTTEGKRLLNQQYRDIISELKTGTRL